MSKTMFKRTQIFILGVTVAGTMYSSVVYLSGIYSNSGAVVNFMALIAIIHIIHTANFCYYFFSVLIYQTVYYYILTYYLKFKIKIINQLITDRLGIFFKCSYFRNYLFIKKTIRELNDIYEEISEYNTKYWAKYLFTFWFIFSVIITFYIYLGVFIEKRLFGRILLFYATFIYFSGLLYIIHISSALYITANNTYKVLNSFILHTNNISFVMKLKVSHFFTNNYH